MATLNEITGSLIEMNVHTRATRFSQGMIFLGLFIAVVALVCFVSYLDNVKKWIRQLVLSIVFIIVGVLIFLYGYKQPKERIVSFCANGPVSIEEISKVYDVIEIDGKLIKVKERR